MSQYVVTDAELTSVANAIRQKGGTQAGLVWPTEFISAIRAISGGGSCNILSGVDEPSSAQGSDGDIYLQHIDLGEKIPSTATLLEYIEATGQYINTGVSGNTADLEIEIKWWPTAGYTSEFPVFGSSWATNGYFLMIYNNRWRFHSGGSVVDDGIADTNDFSIIHTSRTSLIVNGTQYNITGGSDSSNNILLFFVNNQGKYGIGKLGYCQMFSGTTLLRDFYPVKDSNDVPCLYDVVSQTYFYPQSGMFGAGPERSLKSIIETYAKVNNSWQALIGTDIDNINLGGN